jgi:hypothetical protein
LLSFVVFVFVVVFVVVFIVVFGGSANSLGAAEMNIIFISKIGIFKIC